jgi:uncharacterized lipoprotein
MTTSYLVTRRSRFTRGRHTLVLAVLAAISISACGSAGENSDEGTGTAETSTSTPPPSPNTAPAQDASPKTGTPIRIVFGDTRLGARLDDNARRANSPVSSR